MEDQLVSAVSAVSEFNTNDLKLKGFKLYEIETA
jgi:hypothetical protein